MPNYTTNLNLEKPLQDEQYNVEVFNRNCDKIDQFAGQTPPLALSADVLTNGANINGVKFKGNTDVVTGLGLYSNTVTYNNTNIVYIYNSENELKIYKSLQNGNTGNNPIVSPDYWEEVMLGGGKGVAREIGEIVTSSIPITDSGLHLLDGTRLFNDGVYADFVNYIAELYEDNPSANYFTDEETWQGLVAITGSCGKYVYNAEQGSVRLPKIGNSIIQGTTIANELGELIEAGLPAITHTHSGTTSTAGAHTHTRGNMNITAKANFTDVQGDVRTIQSTSGAFTMSSGVSEGGRGHIAVTSGNYYIPLSFDASRNWTGSTSSNGEHNHNFITSENTAVSDIYGNSDTVQPQTIKQFIYVVVAETQKTNIQINIDNIATDLNNKVNTDLSNITWTDDMKQIVYDVIGDGLERTAATSTTLGMVRPDNVTTIVNEEGVLSASINANDYYTKSEIDSMVSTVYEYKGTVDNYDELPSNASIGDVYITANTGDSYVWNGSQWDILSTTIDLTPYATTEYVNQQIQQRDIQISNLSGYIVELQNRVSELERIISGGNA